MLNIENYNRFTQTIKVKVVNSAFSLLVKNHFSFAISIFVN